MVDNSGEYVLQWEGHASNVTERFSTLFARQSLVDVTLICEEQRLRVHKLVLASCSMYFEEMLEQDLGQEPTILLSDLNFDVLKAMVEFMYCGETSVSEQHLQPLLHAARVFKVKELACIAENLIGPANTIVDEVASCVEFPNDDVDDLEDVNDYSLFSDNDCVHSSSKWRKIGADELSCDELDEICYKETGSTQASQSNVVNKYTLEELEPTLYQQDSDVESSTEFHLSLKPLSLAEIACRNVLKVYKEIPQAAKLYMEKIGCEREGKYDANVFNYEKNQPQPVLYEQFCDIANTEGNLNESSNFLNDERSSTEFKEVTRTVDKCLKVYTHKRRKSAEGFDKQFVKVMDNIPKTPISSNCIDLMDEPSKNETEIERDYILSLSNVENVETIIDFANEETSEESVYHFDDNTLLSSDKESRRMKEIFSNNNRIISNEHSIKIMCESTALCTPALRRSVRLNLQENEDSTNNNNSMQDVDRSPKDLRKDSSKKKNKELYFYCQSDENKAAQNSLKKCSDTRRSLRSNNSKLIERRSGKSHLSLSKNNKRREYKTRVNNKGANESGESFSNKFNTIATVSRALWGDMSDCLENSENNIDFSDYSPSKEIPFAVGLLPLRAALERMQAMPDYQPRKTRSSVTTPFRQEFIGKGVKRKNFNGNNGVIDSSNGNVKRHSNGNNLAGNTVCHVHITTSHSQAVKPRRKLINEQVDAAMSQANIVNRQ